jgi:hypothetical protein
MDPKIEIQNRVRDELAASYPGVFNYDRRTVAQIVGCSVGHLANLEAMGCPRQSPCRVGIIGGIQRIKREGPTAARVRAEPASSEQSWTLFPDRQEVGGAPGLAKSNTLQRYLACR